MRWQENENIFFGRQDWGQDEEGDQWQSKVFIPEYSPMIRDAASALQSMLLERGDEIVSLIPLDDANLEFARIREKLLRYYLAEIGFVQKFYEYAVAGCIYGFAAWRETVSPRVIWKPEVVIERIAQAQHEMLSKIKADNSPRPTIFSGSPEEVDQGLEQAVQAILGGSTPSFARPTVRQQKKIELGFDLELVNPHNLFFDPDALDLNESVWVAEVTYAKLFELEKLVEAKVFDASEFKKLAESKSVKSGDSILDNRELQKRRQRDQVHTQLPHMPEIEITEYYGPLLDEDGKVIEEAVHVVIANGQYVLKCAPNQYWDQKPPYMFAVFGRTPFRATGVGIADNAVPLQKASNELISLYFDAVKFDVYAPMGVNTDKLQDPDQIAAGVRPNEMVKLSGTDKAQDVFSSLPPRSNAAAQVFQMVEKLSLSGQKAAAMSTMSSNPASRARISAQEIQSNDARTLKSQNTIGAEIDFNCIERVARKTDSLILQFGWSLDNLDMLNSKEVLTAAEYEMLKNIPEADRFRQATKQIKLKVRGFRALMDREKHLRSTAEMMSQLVQLPPQAQEAIQWNDGVRELVTLHGLDGDKWIRENTPADSAREENLRLKRGQFMSVMPDDDHAAHLMQHYQALIEAGPVDVLVQHVKMHIANAAQMGGQIPPPPPEVSGMLGLPPPGEGPNDEGPSGPTMQ